MLTYLKIAIRNEKGLTYIELLASITILAICIIPLLGFVNNFYGFNKNTQNKTVAQNIGTQNMEALKAANLDNSGKITNFSKTDNVTVNGVQYTVVKEVTPLDTTTFKPQCNTNVAKITVTVSWSGGSLPPYSTLVTGVDH